MSTAQVQLQVSFSFSYLVLIHYQQEDPTQKEDATEVKRNKWLQLNQQKKEVLEVEYNIDLVKIELTKESIEKVNYRSFILSSFSYSFSLSLCDSRGKGESEKALLLPSLYFAHVTFLLLHLSNNLIAILGDGHEDRPDTPVPIVGVHAPCCPNSNLFTFGLVQHLSSLLWQLS